MDIRKPKSPCWVDGHKADCWNAPECRIGCEKQKEYERLKDIYYHQADERRDQEEYRKQRRDRYLHNNKDAWKDK